VPVVRSPPPRLSQCRSRADVIACVPYIQQGKGDFSMEYKAHVPVPQHLQEEMIEELRRQKAEREAN
jgi:hypothetical protein